MAVELVETIEVELPDGSPAIINKADFDPARHRVPGQAAVKSEAKAVTEDAPAAKPAGKKKAE